MLPSNIATALYSVLDRVPKGSCWAVSCGSAMALHGLDHYPNDLDLFASHSEAAQLAIALGDLQTVFPYRASVSASISSHWGRFLAGGVEIDVVGDFSVRRDGREVAWDARHPCWNRLEWIPVGDRLVPTMSIPDLLVLYELLPDEAHKLGLIRASLARGVTCRA